MSTITFDSRQTGHMVTLIEDILSVALLHTSIPGRTLEQLQTMGREPGWSELTYRFGEIDQMLYQCRLASHYLIAGEIDLTGGYTVGCSASEGDVESLASLKRATDALKVCSDDTSMSDHLTELGRPGEQTFCLLAWLGEMMSTAAASAIPQSGTDSARTPTFQPEQAILAKWLHVARIVLDDTVNRMLRACGTPAMGTLADKLRLLNGPNGIQQTTDALAAWAHETSWYQQSQEDFLAAAARYTSVLP